MSSELKGQRRLWRFAAWDQGTDPRKRMRQSAAMGQLPQGAGTPIAVHARHSRPTEAPVVLVGPEFRRGRRRTLMRRTLAVADLSGLLLAFTMTEVLVGSEGPHDLLGLGTETALFLATLPLWLLGANLFGLYDQDDEHAFHSTSDDLARVFLLMTVVVFALTYGSLLSNSANPDLAKLATFWILAIGVVSAARAIGRKFARGGAGYRQKTLIVGAGDVGQLIARKLMMHREYGIDLVGFIDADPNPPRSHAWHVPVLGQLDELTPIVQNHSVERVIFAFSSDSPGRVLPLIRTLRDSGVQVDMVPRLFELIGPRVVVHTVEGTPLIGLAPLQLPRSSRVAKRAIDILVSAAALVLTAPVFAVVAVLIRLDSGGPVFYRHTRLGKDMREFSIVKFRTMRPGTDVTEHLAYNKAGASGDIVLNGNAHFKLDRSDAVTRFGRWLRRTSLDELPQLINVLRGEMSMVGPRPCLLAEVQDFQPHHFDRFLVPAGITGLWQVSARARCTFNEALEMDVLYAHSQSVGLDMRLLLRTPFELLRSQVTA